MARKQDKRENNRDGGNSRREKVAEHDAWIMLNRMGKGANGEND